MEKTYYYKVAGHVFIVVNESDDDVLAWLDHYKPFLIHETDEKAAFVLHVMPQVEADASLRRYIRMTTVRKSWLDILPTDVLALSSCFVGHMSPPW